MTKCEVTMIRDATSDVLGGSAQLGRGKTVLVVEDDPRVRRATFERFTDLGYGVLEAENGAAALRVLGEHAEIEILFSDIVMPGEMSGLDLAKRARSLYPRVHTILTSGYSAELLNGDDERLGVQILRKPYRQVDLVRALREALEGH